MLKKTGVIDLVKVVRKTIPSSESSITETALAELGSAPRLDIGGCVRGSETRLCYYRVEYKLDVMVYRCLHGKAPRYLADHLIPASDAAPRRGRLRSANLNCLTVPHCRLSTYGCRAFDYAGPTV